MSLCVYGCAITAVQNIVTSAKNMGSEWKHNRIPKKCLRWYPTGKRRQERLKRPGGTELKGTWGETVAHAKDKTS